MEATRPHRDDTAAVRRARRFAATVEEMSESSFPASDPPATWNWDPPAAAEAPAAPEDDRPSAA